MADAELAIEVTSEIPIDTDEIPVPRELLRQVARLVNVIHERNAIEAHRDALLEKWASWFASSWIARAIAVVLSFRALFGVDVPTIIEWTKALRVAV